MTDEQDPQGEPEPGSTEWLLAQLSGGRIDSRRERREAEAALEARGVRFEATTGAIALPAQPDGGVAAEQSEQAVVSEQAGEPEQTGEPERPGQVAQPGGSEADAAEQSPDEAIAPDDRPRARFSWETGTLEAMTSPVADEGVDAQAGARRADGAGSAVEASDGSRPAADGAAAGERSLTAPPVAAAQQHRGGSPLWFDDADALPPTFESSFTVPAPADASGGGGGEADAPFQWNLVPTGDADPALRPSREQPASAAASEPLVVPSAAPLIAPKPISRPDAAPLAPPAPPAPGEAPAARSGVEPDAVPVASLGRASDAAPVAGSSSAPDDLPPAEVVPEAADSPTVPEAADSPRSVAATGGPAPLPPGTTSHEFDPFAPDLFAPEAAVGTPVPSVDEFTMPEEGPDARASAPTQAMDVAGFPPTQAMDVHEFLPTQAIPASGDSAPPSRRESPAEAAGDRDGDSDGDGAAAERATGHDVSSNWTDITDLLGAQPETVESSILPQWPPPEGTFDGFAQVVAPAADAIAQAVTPAAVARQSAGRPESAPVEHRRRLPVNRWLLVVVIVLAAVLVVVVLFAVGRAVAGGRKAAPAAAITHSSSVSARPSTSVSPARAATPSAAPSTTPALPPTGTLPAGQTYAWDQLRGGECIAPFDGAWAQQYAVVDCTTPHAAQLVYTAPYSTNPAAAFPGEQAIASQINLLCSKPGVIDLTAAAAYTDVQLVASYPVTAAQWAAGQRNYYCFVTRSSGQPLTSAVQGPGPTQ